MRLCHLPLLLIAAAATCSGQTTQPAAEVEFPETPGLYAVIETSMGRMVALLYDDIAPVTVKNFVDLARGSKPTRDKKGGTVRRPYYNGLTFHRVIKGFMIQTGDVKGTAPAIAASAISRTSSARKSASTTPGRSGWRTPADPTQGRVSSSSR